jgi:hypothetical protein
LICIANDQILAFLRRISSRCVPRGKLVHGVLFLSDLVNFEHSELAGNAIEVCANPVFSWRSWRLCERQKLLDTTENAVAKQVVDAAYQIHSVLGPGLLESVYEAVLASELQKRGLTGEQQQVIPVVYQGSRFAVGLRADWSSRTASSSRSNRSRKLPRCIKNNYPRIPTSRQAPRAVDQLQFGPHQGRNHPHCQWFARIISRQAAKPAKKITSGARQVGCGYAALGSSAANYRFSATCCRGVNLITFRPARPRTARRVPHPPNKRCSGLRPTGNGAAAAAPTRGA